MHESQLLHSNILQSCDKTHKLQLVLAMGPGYLAAVQSEPETLALGRFWNRQGTKPPNHKRFQPGTKPKPTGFWQVLPAAETHFSLAPIITVFLLQFSI
jgi:hypothetical protein